MANLIALAVATAILVAIPGPNVALIVANSIRYGFRAGATTALGVTCGNAIQIVLVVLGDQISNAHQEAQRALGNWAPEPVSVGDLFAGALIPGLALVGLYILYQITQAIFRPESSPPILFEYLFLR